MGQSPVDFEKDLASPVMRNKPILHRRTQNLLPLQYWSVPVLTLPTLNQVSHGETMPSPEVRLNFEGQCQIYLSPLATNQLGEFRILGPVSQKPAKCMLLKLDFSRLLVAITKVFH